jgi:hypothetical protein
MTTPRAEVDAAVAGLQARWGAAAPRVIGSLALAPETAVAPLPDVGPRHEPAPDRDRVIPTDFSFDEAMSFIITGGTVGPDEIAFHGRPAGGERAPAGARTAFPRGGMAQRPRPRPPG